MTLVLIGLFFAALPASNPSAHAQELNAWLKKAELGPYAPTEEDWDAVYERAKAEPPLLVYMSTSRVTLKVDTFREQWPGVEVEGQYIRQADLLPRLEREWSAGVWNVGVLNMSGPETFAYLPLGSYVSYVPPEYRDLYPERYQEPVFISAISLTGWAYNPDVSPDGPPFASLWDLTTEEFRERVILEDPTRSSGTATWLMAIVSKADELQADYEARFGEPLQLRERDAGFEWLRRLLENRPHVFTTWRDGAEILTNSDEPMVADMNFIRMADVHDGTFNMEFVRGVTPASAVANPRWYAIGTHNRSPNAAKLFIRSMMTEEAGSPFFDRGFLSPRADWKPSMPWMQSVTDITFWDADPDFLLREGPDVMDFWLLFAP